VLYLVTALIEWAGLPFAGFGASRLYYDGHLTWRSAVASASPPPPPPSASVQSRRDSNSQADAVAFLPSCDSMPLSVSSKFGSGCSENGEATVEEAYTDSSRLGVGENKTENGNTKNADFDFSLP
jgi:hypothetical protein